jgi:hypothetical protein
VDGHESGRREVAVEVRREERVRFAEDGVEHEPEDAEGDRRPPGDADDLADLPDDEESRPGQDEPTRPPRDPLGVGHGGEATAEGLESSHEPCRATVGVPGALKR